MSAGVVLNRSEIGRILKSQAVADMVTDAAEKVAANVRAQGRTVTSGDPLPAKVDTYETDRAAASVTITHPAGIGMQAKHGVLTRAAADAGLEVNAAVESELIEYVTSRGKTRLATRAQVSHWRRNK